MKPILIVLLLIVVSLLETTSVGAQEPIISPVTGKPLEPMNSAISSGYVPDYEERKKWGVDTSPYNTNYNEQIRQKKLEYYGEFALYGFVGLTILVLVIIFVKIINAAN